MAAKNNYQHLVKICERLELDGYWEQPQKILKQPILTTLNTYVQSVLLLYAIYANCLTPQIRLWLRTITGEDAIRIADLDKNEAIIKQARKITYSPPILLQLCGVADRNDGSESACVFLDSMLNLILVIACQAQSPARDVTRFIQEYYQHIQVFLNQDTADQKMNARYLFRKLSCERIEDSLCLYLEDKQRKERQKKIKEELERLDLSENKRRKTYLATGEEEEKEDEEDPFEVSVSSDGVVWEQEESEAILDSGKQKEADSSVFGQEKEPPEGISLDSERTKEAEPPVIRQEKETRGEADLDFGGLREAQTSVFGQEKEIQEEAGILELEALEEASEWENVTSEPSKYQSFGTVIFEKAMYHLDTLNINGRYKNPTAMPRARILGLVEKKGKTGGENLSLQEQEQQISAEAEDGQDAQIPGQAAETAGRIQVQDIQQEEHLPDMEAIREGFHSLKERMENARTKELDLLLDELHSLIGLSSVKEEIDSLINLIKVRKMREQYDMPTMDMTYHMVFTGSPGTGKTTVARLVAKIYKELGILSKGGFVETDRSGLVAGYIGQTAIKVKEVVESALGGVLFIDEAYSLTNGNRTEDFGGEVIDTLVKLMEDHRDDLVVIVAGYTKEMKEFLKSNSGLVSRFNKFIEFKDYTDTELLDILDSMAGKAGFTLEPAARAQIGGQLLCMTEQKRREFGNARGMRNVFEKIVVNQANRLVEAAAPTKEELALLTEDDVVHVILP